MQRSESMCNRTGLAWMLRFIVKLWCFSEQDFSALLPYLHSTSLSMYCTTKNIHKLYGTLGIVVQYK
jgi:hypothetical protein